jgi:hypothetical protein
MMRMSSKVVVVHAHAELLGGELLGGKVMVVVYEQEHTGVTPMCLTTFLTPLPIVATLTNHAMYSGTDARMQQALDCYLGERISNPRPAYFSTTLLTSSSVNAFSFVSSGGTTSRRFAIIFSAAGST